MRRWGLLVTALLVVGALAGWYLLGFARIRRPIVVGILHSQSGAMEISERSMIDAEMPEFL